MTEVPFVYLLCKATIHNRTSVIYGSYCYIRIRSGEIIDEEGRSALFDFVYRPDWAASFMMESYP